LLHDLARTHASFDDPNLVSRAGLVPVMALAQRAGLAGLVAEHVRISAKCRGERRAEGRLPGRGDGRRGGQHRWHGCATRRTACIARVAGADRRRCPWAWWLTWIR